MADERVLIEIEAEDNASSKIDKVSSSIQNLGTSTNNLGRGTGVSGFLQSWETGLHKFNSTMRQYNATMSGINNFTKRMLKDAGAAVWDFTTDSVEAYAEFTEQHAKVLGVMANQNEYKITYDDNLDEVSAKQQRFLEDANKLKSQSIQLGTYGIDSQGSLMDISSVSAIQEELLKSGVSSKDILSTDIVQQLMKFSVGNDLSTTESVDFAVALGSQFGIKPQDWGDMLDKVAHTADVSVIDVADVVQSMKYAGGITAGIDRPLEETLAEIAVLGNFGLKGSQGGTGIQALLTRLLTQDTTVITDAQKEVAPEKALKAFYDFSTYAKSDGSGLTYDQIANATSYEELGKLSGNLRPMTEIIDQMDEVMSELNDEEQAWFAKKFFGLYQMKAAYGLLNGEETDLQAVIDEIMMQSSGTNDNKYSQLLESSYGKKEAFANLMQGIKVDFGERLSPFTDKIYEELTKFLSDPNNYEIDFEGLRQALQDSCDLIEEKYGTAIANAVENIGDLSIDLTQVMTELGPDIIEGVATMLGSATEGDIVGLVTDWGTMIDNMHASADELPEDLQGLADGITNVIDWFGKLMALNVATEIAELISSVLQILTIAGGAIINVAGAVVVNGSGTGGVGTGGLGTGGTGTGTGTGGNGSGGTTVVPTSNNKTGFGNASTANKILGIGAVALPAGVDAYNAIKENERVEDSRKQGVYEDKSEVYNQTGKSIGSLALGVPTLIATGNPALAGGAAVLGSEGFDGASDQFYYGTTGIGVYDDWKRQQNEDDYDIFKIDQMNTEIRSLAQKLADADLGSGFGGMNVEEWMLALANPYGDNGIYAEYDKMSGNDRLLLQGMLNDTPSVVGNSKDFQDVWASGEWKKTYDERLAQNYETINDLGAQMLFINKNNEDTAKCYDAAMDTMDQGWYTVWTGTQEQLQEYVKAQQNTPSITPQQGTPEYEHYQQRLQTTGMTDENPYMLNELSDAVKNGIIQGLSEKESKTDKTDTSKLPDGWAAWSPESLQNYMMQQSAVKTPQLGLSTFDLLGNINSSLQNSLSNMSAGQMSINSSQTTLTGEVKIPNDIWSAAEARVKQNTPGWAALSQKGMNDLIQNEINNQIQIDDSVTMTPSFNVAAPNVNVNVHVDQAGNATTTKSILNPGLPSTLNNYYSRTSKQYATQNKK